MILFLSKEKIELRRKLHEQEEQKGGEQEVLKRFQYSDFIAFGQSSDPQLLKAG